MKIPKFPKSLRHPKPENEVDRRHMSLINEHGWAIWHIFPVEPEDDVSFSYSTGIWQTLGKPEIIIFAMPEDLARHVINSYGEMSRTTTFEPLKRYSDFLDGYDVQFVEVDPVKASVDLAYTTWTHWYYDRRPFPLLQMVLPDRKGRFPWHSRCPASFQKIQPVIGDGPVANAR